MAFTGKTGGGITSTVSPNFISNDANGNLWLPLSNGNLAEFNPSGTPLSGTSGFSGLSLTTTYSNTTHPSAFDGAGNLYVINPGGNSVQKINTNLTTPTSTTLTGGGLSGPTCVAIGPSGTVWVLNGGTAGLSEFAANGTAITATANYTGAGISNPSWIAIDGAGTVWVSNRSAEGFSAFSSSGAPLTTTVLGSAYIAAGYLPTVAIYAADSVWTTFPLTNLEQNYPNLQLVGLAAPVATPLALAVKNNTVAVRP